MTDDTDDWMNPPKREPYVSKPIKYPRFFIERKRRLDYFPFEEWGVWKIYEAATERDAELSKLREEHPRWLLRTRDEYHAPLSYN